MVVLPGGTSEIRETTREVFRKLLQHDTDEAVRILCDNMKIELDALRNKECDETDDIDCTMLETEVNGATYVYNRLACNSQDSVIRNGGMLLVFSLTLPFLTVLLLKM
ncbi:uncharacterized protein LOC113232551 [Hyposmocoma kahamanoa]|uniref:uncharacterized protein LOC113232551 n=1 Tax=Hyposmocoma kahamanoa TaxID=1477025 RepID=UPI000E6D7772|nr:uncharacterized protein LOC113232551 [Hyposmocoma kahamanoa]